MNRRTVQFEHVFPVVLHTLTGIAEMVTMIALPFAFGGATRSELVKYYTFLVPVSAIYCNYSALSGYGYRCFGPPDTFETSVPAFLRPLWLFPRKPGDSRYAPKTGFSRTVHYAVLCVFLRVLEPMLTGFRQMHKSKRRVSPRLPHPASSDSCPRAWLREACDVLTPQRQGKSQQWPSALPSLAVADLLKPWADTQLRIPSFFAAICNAGPSIRYDVVAGSPRFGLVVGLFLTMFPDTSRVPAASWLLLAAGAVHVAADAVVAGCWASRDPVMALARGLAHVSDAWNASVLVSMGIGCFLSPPAKTIAELGWAPVALTVVAASSTLLSAWLAHPAPSGPVGVRLALLLDALMRRSDLEGAVMDEDASCRLAVAALAAAPPTLRTKLESALVHDLASPLLARRELRGSMPLLRRHVCSVINVLYPAALFATVAGNPEMPVSLQTAAALSTVLACASVATGCRRIVRYRLFLASSLNGNSATIATQQLVPFIARPLSPPPGRVLRSLAGVGAAVLPADVLDDVVGPFVDHELVDGVPLTAVEQLANDDLRP
jgi:hypothetical protein